MSENWIVSLIIRDRLTFYLFSILMIIMHVISEITLFDVAVRNSSYHLLVAMVVKWLSRDGNIVMSSIVRSEGNVPITYIITKDYYEGVLEDSA